MFGDKLCYLKSIHPYVRCDANHVYDSTTTYIYDGGCSQASIRVKPIICNYGDKKNESTRDNG